MVQQAQSSLEAREVAVKEQKVQIDAFDAATRRMVALRPPDAPKQMEQPQQELPPPLDPNKQMIERNKAMMQERQHDHEAGMARMQAAHAAEQAEQQAAHTAEQAEQQAALQPPSEGKE